MRINKLEIAGFKSFGGRKKITFGEGITAMVGPNGSGKSNIADAIRWVLGEQKLRRLRVQKSEDIIFLGTKQKPKASLAEVSILLDNSKKLFDIDVSEVEISRKLYRSGEIEYRLNSKRAKLSDINERLAKAGFGTETYTVIGQGMVDQLLTSSPEERKLLFDEASGIRQYEIRRNNALKKLQKAEDNLVQVSNILQELLPTKKLLDTYAKNQHRKAQLEKLLVKQKTKYLSHYWAFVEQSIKNHISKQTQLKNQLQLLNKDIQKFHKLNKSSNQPAQTTELLKSLELEKDSLVQQILSRQNEQQVLLEKKSKQDEQLRQLEKEIQKINTLRTKYQKEFAKQNTKIEQLQQKIDDCNIRLNKVNSHLKQIQTKLEKNQKKEFINHALGLVQTIRIQLRQEKIRRKIDVSLQRVLQMLELAGEDDSSELFEDTTKLQREITYLMTAREEYIELQANHTIKLRAIELDIAALDVEQQAINKQRQSLQLAIGKAPDNSEDIRTIVSDIERLNTKLVGVTEKVDQLRQQIYSVSQNSQQNQKLINQAEANAAHKKELEISVHELSESLQTLLKQKLELTQMAKNWGIKSYKKLTMTVKELPSQNDINKTTSEIEAILDIDMVELEQARNSQKRLEFLYQQKKDLEKAILSSQSLVDSLQLDIKTKFEKSFNKLNHAFSNYFKRLFLGGDAALALSQHEDKYGIEIIANPPNKRIKSLSSLSGGERALTSIALLSAIIQTNPSPFIVLDEVDAALDDENSTKFCEILQDLSKKSQVLVVTHNQETMQIANNLVGITTARDGDSEILQLNLEKATELTKNAG